MNTAHSRHWNGNFLLSSLLLPISSSSCTKVHLSFGNWIVTLVIFVSVMASLLQVNSSQGCRFLPCFSWQCNASVFYSHNVLEVTGYKAHNEKGRAVLGKGLAQCSVHMQREDTCWKVPWGSFFDTLSGYKHHPILTYFKICSLDFFKTTWNKFLCGTNCIH